MSAGSWMIWNGGTVTATTNIVTFGMNDTITVGHSFGRFYAAVHEAMTVMERFAAALVKCRIPNMILIAWITAAERLMPRKSAKVGDVAMVRPAIRPARARSVHHGEHLLNFHRC